MKIWSILSLWMCLSSLAKQTNKQLKSCHNNHAVNNNKTNTATSLLIFTLRHIAPRPSPSLSKRTTHQVRRRPSLPPPLPLPVPWNPSAPPLSLPGEKNPKVSQRHDSHRCRLASSCSASTPCFPRAGSGEDRPSSSSGDGRPPLGTAGPVPPSPSSLWITERADGGGNTLAGSPFRPFTSSSSLLTVLMHTTQPMFTGRIKHHRVKSTSIFFSKVKINTSIHSDCALKQRSSTFSEPGLVKVRVGLGLGLN